MLYPYLFIESDIPCYLVGSPTQRPPNAMLRGIEAHEAAKGHIDCMAKVLRLPGVAIGPLLGI